MTTKWGGKYDSGNYIIRSSGVGVLVMILTMEEVVVELVRMLVYLVHVSWSQN